MMTLKQFRDSRVSLDPHDANFHDSLRKINAFNLIDGWDFDGMGVTEMHVYRFDEMPFMILKQREGDKMAFAYTWMHPCDEYEDTLKKAEAKLFQFCREEC